MGIPTGQYFLLAFALSGFVVGIGGSMYAALVGHLSPEDFDLIQVILHFAIIMAVNLTVGLLTPPMGLVLFVSSSVSGLRVETIAKATLPFLAAEIVVIFLITYFPALTLTVPRLAGFVD